MARVCLVQLDRGEGGFRAESALSICNLAEPLGLLSIHASLSQAGHNVKLVHPGLQSGGQLDPSVALDQIQAFRPDMVGFSAMTSQVPASRAVAEALNRGQSELLMVIGGDHISGYPEDLLEMPEFDVAVVGEGEECACWLADNIGVDMSHISSPSGVHWCENGSLIGRSCADRIADLDRLPFATRFDPILQWSRVGALMSPPPSKQIKMASLYASRGCPYQCPYCDSRQVWGRSIAWRTPESVVEELRLLKRRGVTTAFFVDLTFNANQANAMQICEAVASAELGISWYVLLRPQDPCGEPMVDRELLAALKRAGCAKVGIGVETLSSQVGRDLRRHVTGEHIHDLTKWMDELGILSKLFLMMGHPHETQQYHRTIGESLLKLAADEVRLSFLTPFPGTPLWKSFRHLLSEDIGYEAYTSFDPIIQHPTISHGELRRTREHILRSYYSSDRYHRRTRAKASRFPNLADGFAEFADYVAQQLAVRI